MFKNISAPIADFMTVAVEDAAHLRLNTTPTASECVLRWCVKTMAATYSNGVLTEREIAVSTSNSVLGDPLVTNVTTFDEYYTQNITLRSPSGNGNFFIRNDSALQMRYAIDEYVPSYLTTDTSDPNSLLDLRYFSFSDNRVSTMTSTPWLSAGGVEGYVAKMADAMTTALRNNNETSDLAFGPGALEVFVVARWKWLSLPILVLVLTAIFLFAAMYQSRGHRIRKASSLAILAQSLSPRLRSELESTKSLRELRERAKDLKVYIGSSDMNAILLLEDATKDSQDNSIPKLPMYFRSKD